jgi:zinc protease
MTAGPARALDAELGILADYAFRSKLAPDEYARGAANWAEASRHQTMGLLQAERAILFGSAHPYGYVAPRAKVLPLSEAQALHARVFQPDQATLVLVGDLSPDWAAASVTGAFGAWSAGEPLPPKRIEAPRRAAPQVSVVSRRQSGQIRASVFARTPNPTATDLTALSVLAQVLGGAYSSHLFEHLRSGTGDAYFVDSSLVEWRAASWLAVRASFDQGKAVDGVRDILAAIREARAGHVTDDEIATARETLLADWRATMSTVAGAATAYAHWHPAKTGGEPHGDPRTLPERLAAIGRDDITRVANAYLDSKALRVVFIGDDRWLGAESLGLGDPAFLEAPSDPW